MLKKPGGKAMVADSMDFDPNPQDDNYGSYEEDEEQVLITMASEQDGDACYALQFEDTLGKSIQQHDGMANAFMSYLEARRRISQKRTLRGVWPLGAGKKGKGKGKTGKGFGGKTLAERIASSIEFMGNLR